MNNLPSTLKYLWPHYNKGRSEKCSLVKKVAITFVINQVWETRNNVICSNHTSNHHMCINMILANVKVASKYYSSSILASMYEFSLIKAVILQPHNLGWIQSIGWSFHYSFLYFRVGWNFQKSQRIFLIGFC